MDTLDRLDRSLRDSSELIDLAADESDDGTLAEVAGDVDRLEEEVARLEFRRMFSGEMDARNAFLDIQSGSGGTEAQDWAEMLLRMYLRLFLLLSFSLFFLPPPFPTFLPSFLPPPPICLS